MWLDREPISCDHKIPFTFDIEHVEIAAQLGVFRPAVLRCWRNVDKINLINTFNLFFSYNDIQCLRVI